MFKRAYLLLPFLFALACGGNLYHAGQTTGEHNNRDVRVAGQGVESLLRRGYTLKEVNRNSIRTEWRHIKFYPDTSDETWFGLRISVDFDDYSFHIRAYCRQQRAQVLRESWHWRPCTDPDVLKMLENSVRGLGDDLQRHY